MLIGRRSWTGGIVMCWLGGGATLTSEPECPACADRWRNHLERINKSCSRAAGSESGVEAAFLALVFVSPQSQPHCGDAPSAKPRPRPKIHVPRWLQLFLIRSKAAIWGSIFSHVTIQGNGVSLFDFEINGPATVADGAGLAGVRMDGGGN